MGSQDAGERPTTTAAQDETAVSVDGDSAVWEVEREGMRAARGAEGGGGTASSRGSRRVSAASSRSSRRASDVSDNTKAQMRRKFAVPAGKTPVVSRLMDA